MINKIQKLIEELELEKSMLLSEAQEYIQELDSEQGAECCFAKAEGIDFCIRKLTLLLNTEKEEDR